MRLRREDDQDCPSCDGSGWLDGDREEPPPPWRRRPYQTCEAGREAADRAEAAAEAEGERRAEDRRRRWL